MISKIILFITMYALTLLMIGTLFEYKTYVKTKFIIGFILGLIATIIIVNL